MRPLIGITMNEVSDYGANLRWQYYHALSLAGALPVALPPLDPALCKPMLMRLDGLLLAGGADIAPCHYGEGPLPGLGEAEPLRDAWELALTREAWKRQLPLLAICRGMQVLNVALGGSLWQDSSYRPGTTTTHQQQEPSEQVTQKVRLIPPLTKLLRVEALTVNSHHHQMLRRLSPCLQEVALAEDGVVEAVLPAPPYAGFCLGVQWHPERLDNEESRRIFATFVAAAQEYATTGRI